MRTRAGHRSAGQVGCTGAVVAPSSTIRAEAAGASVPSAATRAGISRRVRFMPGFQTPPSPRGCGSLLVAIGDPAAIQVVWGQLDLHPVAGQDADVVPPHLARDVAEHLVPIVELNLEHRVREGLDDLALHLDLLFLGHGGTALRSRGRSPPWVPCRPSPPRTRPSSSRQATQLPRRSAATRASSSEAAGLGPTGSRSGSSS